MKGKMIAEICPLLFLSLRPLSHTMLLQTIQNYSQLKEKKQYTFNPIKADISLTHGNSLLRADAKDIIGMIH